MTPQDAASARALLRSELLVGREERAVVFGSFGLALHGTFDIARVPDVDVIATFDDAVAMGRALHARNFTVQSWQDELGRDDIVAARLAGRVYLRATRATLCIDVTYELFDVAEWRVDASVIDGVTVASVARIERQRAIRRAGTTA